MADKDRVHPIELLVVIVIIGILSAIAVPVFLNQPKKAVDVSLKVDVKNAAPLVETWIADHPGETIPWSVTMATTTVPGEGVLTGVKVSPGTSMAVQTPPASHPGAYCVYASNSRGSPPTKLGCTSRVSVACRPPP